MFALVNALLLLLGNGETDTLALRERHPLGGALTDDEHVGNACGELVAYKCKL